MRMRSAGDVLHGVVERFDLLIAALRTNSSSLASRNSMCRPIAEIGTVELEDEPSGDDRLVLGSHRFGERVQIRLMRRIVLIGLEDGDRAGRRGRS